MSTSKTTREHISAFADGELADSQVDMVLAALRQPEGKAAWDDYHQIGDMLRSNEAAVELSSDFAARMAARLHAEPTIMAPLNANAANARMPEPQNAALAASSRHGSVRRFAVPGMSIAAATVVALLSAPQIMTALKGGAENSGNAVDPASAQVVAASSASSAITHASIVAVAAPSPQAVASSSGNPKDGVMLRDPNMDEYLLAHQRFSPSMYSTAQFARSSLLANESDK